MVKHVVMWKLKDVNDASELKKDIEGMNGKIPGMISVEAGINFNSSPAACDLVLISVHDDRAALDGYQKDPVHLVVKEKIGKAAESAAVVDFEV